MNIQSTIKCFIIFYNLPLYETGKLAIVLSPCGHNTYNNQNNIISTKLLEAVEQSTCFSIYVQIIRALNLSK